MKTLTLLKVVKDLERLNDKYEHLKDLIVDQIRDNQIEEAQETFQEILSIKKAIKQMELLEVTIK